MSENVSPMIGSAIMHFLWAGIGLITFAIGAGFLCSPVFMAALLLMDTSHTIAGLAGIAALAYVFVVTNSAIALFRGGWSALDRRTVSVTIASLVMAAVVVLQRTLLRGYETLTEVDFLMLPLFILGFGSMTAIGANLLLSAWRSWQQVYIRLRLGK